MVSFFFKILYFEFRLNQPLTFGIRLFLNFTLYKIRIVLQISCPP
jgi:hypothetical protein